MKRADLNNVRNAEVAEIWGTGIPQMIRDSQIELNARIKRMINHYETQKSFIVNDGTNGCC